MSESFFTLPWARKRSDLSEATGDNKAARSVPDDDDSVSSEEDTQIDMVPIEVQEDKQTGSFFEGMAKNFMKIAGGGGAAKEQAVSDIVAGFHDSIQQGDAEEQVSFSEIMNMFDQYKESMGEVATKYMKDINMRKLSPTAIAYYLEREDEIKNPSWKRREHRFCPRVSLDTVTDLNDALYLANLCYADTADDIRQGLLNHKVVHDLVYCNVRSEPGKPAHFIAVKRDQTSNSKIKRTSTSLKVLIGVRGTKSAADAITDVLCDTADYKDGKAHKLIMESGQHIADKHRDMLEQLREKAGKKKVKVMLVGHSLGAGAASIAGMEMHSWEDPKVEVRRVIGFGCPALVSREIAEEAKYITTVVNDSDVVPRMSGLAIANLILDIMQFNWLDYARNDLRHFLAKLQERNSFIFREATTKVLLEKIEPLMDQYQKGTLLSNDERPERLDPEVYPPGNCIHFYRDGSGVSGCYVPNTYFKEIEVSRRMIDDHVYHTGYQKSLLEFARQIQQDHHFKFE